MRTLLIAALLVAGCGKVDKAAVMDDITAKLKEKGLDHVTVVCPDPPSTEAGTTFTCTGTNKDDGRPFTITAKVQDGGKNVTWQLVGKILTPATLGPNIEPTMTAKLGKPAKLACTGKPIILAPGDSITCPVTIETEQLHAKLSIAANGDDVNWEIVQ
ncbi:MAG TPA: DUF4333 domain-containing protein [Kofleriaceae bacterium]